MNLFNVFDIAGSALTAQSQRLNTTASNLANAESVVGPDGKPYRAKQPVFRAVAPETGVGPPKVAVAGVIEDASPGRRVHQPGHPSADTEGFVTMPNVSIVDEMVNMISASRAYQSNVEVMNTAKSLLAKTLQLGQ